jgi:hypothetical protein
MTQGIDVSACVQVDGDCTLVCDVIGDQAQFEFGGGSLSLIASEHGLERLAGMASEALTRLKAIPVGQEVNFRVTPTA